MAEEKKKKYYYEASKYPGILRYIGAKEESYVIDFYANGKRHREKVEGGLTKAREELEKRRKAGRLGTFVSQHRMKKFTMEDLIEKYRKDKANNPYFEKTEIHYIDVIEKYFQKRKLLSIKPWDIAEFLRERKAIMKPNGESRSNSSVNREVALLRHLLNTAVFNEMLEVNPFDRFSREQKREQKKVFSKSPNATEYSSRKSLTRSSPTVGHISEISSWGFYIPASE